MKFQIYSLGNPGNKYKITRHNAGRIVADAIDILSLESEINKKLNISELSSKIKLIYTVPDSFMNETGKYISRDLKNKNLFLENIILIYDDIDLPFGTVRLSFDKSSGGHNGVQSVIDNLNTRMFYRIRIGIGEKSIKEMPLQDYVMSDLTKEELEILMNQNMQSVVQSKIFEVVNAQYKAQDMLIS
jgi:peptidyl-tRNA hydrolase, PTH1 family